MNKKKQKREKKTTTIKQQSAGLKGISRKGSLNQDHKSVALGKDRTHNSRNGPAWWAQWPMVHSKALKCGSKVECIVGLIFWWSLWLAGFP